MRIRASGVCIAYLFIYLFIYLFPFYFHRVALSVDKQKGKQNQSS